MSFTRFRFHIVLGTHRRRPLITAQLERLVFAALREGIQLSQGHAFALNGIETHVHLAVAIRAHVAPSTFVRDIKSHSSRVIRETAPEFRWQVGYAAFTVDPRNMTPLVEYIHDQKEHHRRGLLVADWEWEPD
jgi:REP element-mobilizing transposase RayT